MNCSYYCARQAGGPLPYFVGARVQCGQRLGSVLGGLLRSAMPLIKRGAVTLGKRALKNGVHIADDVMSSQNIKTAAKRHATEAGKDLLSGLLSTPPPPGVRPPKRQCTKRTIAYRRFSTAQMHRQMRTADVIDDDDGVRS